MKKILILGLVLLMSAVGISQTVDMGEDGYPIGGTVDCAVLGAAPDLNFFDDGGAGGNYSADFNDTTYFCPDLVTGTKMSIIFGVGGSQGYVFDVHDSDTIYVYDGPDANAPLLGAINSSTNPTGATYTASWNNPSGCLTVVFISNSADESVGWAAQATCGNPVQPFVPHIEAFINGQGANALNPVDSGFVDICFGDSVLFVAKPDFPHSVENTGFGYSQHVDSTIDFTWNIAGVTFPDNDSIWFTPPARNGYLVDLQLTDMFPNIAGLFCAVRVSQQPSFAGTGPLEDTVCLGETTQLLGGVTAQDTVGVDIPEGTFELGGILAGTTHLPDGDGAEYTTGIDISGFPSGSVISNSQDLNQVCLDMEHTYMGDLEIWLECPNGTLVTLFDGYNGGAIPGGNAGGPGNNLGDPVVGTTPGDTGDGWEYCFSSAFNTAGTMSAENTAGNHVATTDPPNNSNGNSMNPNEVYTPETDFGVLAGCPLNGTWTIHVQDNILSDDGYIYQWGLFFDPSFFGDIGSYQNVVEHDFWSDDPAIISQTDTTTGQTDTLLTVQPNAPGDYEFTYNVIDDFGCHYDTTVSMYVIPLASVMNDTAVCDYNITLYGTESFEGGVWTVDTSVITLNDSLLDNPYAFADTAGTQMFIYTDNRCGSKDTVNINFITDPYGNIGGELDFCVGSNLTLSGWHPEGFVDEYLWSTGATTQDLFVDEAGQYWLQYINQCGVYTDTVNVTSKICDIHPPNVITLNDDGINDQWFVQSEGVQNFNCQIRNRWGNVIYEFNDVNGSWDGRTKSGQKVAEGTYFYIITAEDESGQPLMKQGFIVVKHD